MSEQTCPQGTTLKEGKCEPVQKGSHKETRSKNPFKMAGSYIGALIGLLATFYNTYTCVNSTCKTVELGFPFWAPYALIPGLFLVGWLLQLAVRGSRG